MSTYPDKWPKPNPFKPNAVASRVTEEQREDLYNRRLTTRALAKLLDVHEKYVTHLFPGKAPIADKKQLIEARKLYKLEIAKQVMVGKYSIQQAADVAHVSYNTMHRNLAKAKLAHPELLATYEKVCLRQKQLTIKEARNVQSNVSKFGKTSGY